MVLDSIFLSQQIFSPPPTIVASAPLYSVNDPRLLKVLAPRATTVPLASSASPIAAEAIADTAQTTPTPTSAPSPPPTSSPTPAPTPIPESTPTPAPTPTEASPATPGETPLTDDELFERTFGRPRPRGTQQLPVPFFIDRQPQGELIVLLTPGGLPAVRLQAAPFLLKVAEVVRSDVLDQLKAAVTTDGTLSLEALRQAGLEAIFDERRLELQVEVPAAKRRSNVIGGQPGLPPEAKNALPPSPVSGYVNLRGGQDLIWSAESFGTGRQPFRLSLDGALNVAGWVLEGFADFREQNDPLWSRGDLRIVRDAPTNAIRYVAGDLAIPIIVEPVANGSRLKLI